MTTIATFDGFEARPDGRNPAGGALGPRPAASASSVAGPARPALREFRPANPATALGLAVSYLMTKPAFARLTFGAWSRVLVGQTNRGHYRFVLDDAHRVVGFLGWVLTHEANAEDWLHGRAAPSDAPASSGDCIVFNAWAAEAPAVNRVLLDLAREAMLGRRLIYFKRAYDDGDVRPVRMRVNDFVANHARRRTGS